MKIQTAYYLSPISILTLRAEDEKIIYLGFNEEGTHKTDSPALLACMTQLDEYFAGKRKIFDLPLELRGTDFRKRVWAELLNISYGETRSYKDIAHYIGNPKAVRAVGGANHHNPVSIIVPCHRVIAANGALTGYGGELWRKEWLLAHEAKY